jgi:hypothetical protein
MTRERRYDRFWRITAIVVCVAVVLGIVLLLSQMKDAGTVVRRMSWTPFVALLLLIVTLVVPERRWGRALWLPWALMSVACAVYAFHLMTASVCRGLWRIFGIPALVILAALSAIAAIYGAISQRTRSVDPDQLPKVPGTPTDILT